MDALHQAGAAASLVTLPDLRSWRDLTTGHDAPGGTAPGVILQYFPQAFTRPGFPGLLIALQRVRAAGRPVILTAHELWVHKDGKRRRALLHHVHRSMMAALLRRVDRVVVTTPHARDTLVGSGYVDASRVAVVPVGPNITPGGVEVPRSGGSDVPGSTLVMFGQPGALHPGALTALGRWLEECAGTVRLVWLSRSPDELRHLWSAHGLSATHVVFAGGLPATALSAHIASADLGLAPYVDGASTRRSSLSSLLAHGLPIVGLDGPITDPLLRDSGALALTPLADAAGWTRQIAEVLGDQPRRAQMGAAARRLSERALAWPVIARRYLELAGPPDPR